MEWILCIVGLIVGASGMAAFFLVRRAAAHGGAQAALANATARASLLDEQLRQRAEEIISLRRDLTAAGTARETAELQAAVTREQFAAAQRQFEEQKRMLADAEKKLGDSFAALGARALAANNEQFLSLARKAFEALMTEAKGDVDKKQQAIDSLVKPVRELLEKHAVAVTEIEKKREVAYRGMEEQIKAIASSHDGLRMETTKLVTALRRPHQRGRWGEFQLRNAVELAGMTEYCDFLEQQTLRDADAHGGNGGGGGAQRPDMIVKMPGGGRIVVDSKVALEAYLDALEAGGDGADRESLLDRHARQVEDHVRKLAEKQYWKQFDQAPDWVVMFMPLESALIAALERKPELQAEAMRQHVLIATPTLLVALLASIACGWQREDVAANAREISKTGRELYERLTGFADSFEKVGEQIGKAAATYNKAIGTLETRILPSARRLKELRVASGDSELPHAPAPIEIEVRPITSPELQRLPYPDAAAQPAES